MDSSFGQFELVSAPTPTPINFRNCFFCILRTRIRNLTISLSNLLLLIFDICMLGITFWMRNSVVATLELAITIWINNEEKLNKLLANIMGNKFLIFWTLVPTFVSIFQIIGSNFDGRKFNQDAAYGIMCLCLAILFISYSLFTLICLGPDYKLMPTFHLFVAAIGTISMIGVKFDEKNPVTIVCVTGVTIALIVGIKIVTIIIVIPLIIVNSMINSICVIKLCNRIIQGHEK